MKVFMSGIAGTGMSSLAGLFREKGYEISGSDTSFYPPVGPLLKKMGVHTYEGYSENNIENDIDFCVIGNIISRGNPEVEFILNNKIRFFSMAEALYRFFIEGSRSIVVSGTHGKTTISSFLALLLKEAELDPGYFIGGKPIDLDSNYSLGSNNFFVSEGDEYETSFFDRSSKFLKYFPDILILSSLEYDHLDFFKSEREYKDAFKNLINQVPSNGLIISNSDYTMNREVIKGSFSPVLEYGLDKADYSIKDVVSSPAGISFRLKIGNEYVEFKTPLQGEYNVKNLTAGIISGIHIGVPLSTIKKVVKKFNGVERRLNKIGEDDNTVIYEDFAHHPTSIGSVLMSLKKLYPHKKLTALFEPASWSLKNRYFENKLIESLSVADEVVIKIPYKISKIPKNERIDMEKLIHGINIAGKKGVAMKKISEFETFLENISHKEQRVVVILSNGSFGSLPKKAEVLFA